MTWQELPVCGMWLVQTAGGKGVRAVFMKSLGEKSHTADSITSVFWFCLHILLYFLNFLLNNFY